MPPGLELTAAVYACWRAGAAIVVADTGLGWRRMAEALRSADPDYLIGIPAAMPVAAALRIPGQRILVGGRPTHPTGSGGIQERITRGHRRRSEPIADPEAAVLLTSGATGPPKGVVYRHAQLRTQVELVRAVGGITPEDRLVAAFAPFALYGPALGSAPPSRGWTSPARAP